LGLHNKKTKKKKRWEAALNDKGGKYHSVRQNGGLVPGKGHCKNVRKDAMQATVGGGMWGGEKTVTSS